MTSTTHPGSRALPDSFPFLPSGSFSAVGGSQIEGSRSELLATESGTSYEYRVQSAHFCDDNDHHNGEHVDALLLRNVEGRITRVGERLAETLFPDAAFGFPINDQFLSNFFGSFLGSAGLLDPANFFDEEITSVFLNRMISTIDQFLQATKEPELANFRPLRYFSAMNSKKPVSGGRKKLKPDLILLRLIDGRLREGTGTQWHDIQALVEQTRELKPPIRMKETVIEKSFQIFCAQPERDFVISLCITREGFHIVVADHSGIVETDVIRITQHTSPVLVRMVMGFAFLPDSFLGVDMTITRNELGIASGNTFQSIYEPYSYQPSCHPITLLRNQLPSAKPLAISTTPVVEGFDKHFSTVTVGDTVYQVISVIFSAKSFIGRTTRALLVQLPDGKRGVLKDSWIPISRMAESKFLEELAIPFGPEIIDHCILRNTGTFRSHAITSSALDECREKRRIVVYPAGVHIADFSCLWELMAAFLDIVITIVYLESHKKLHRDISYTNILLREPGVNSEKMENSRKAIIARLGLAELNTLRLKLKCREGLLVDFDYGGELTQELTQLHEGMTKGMTRNAEEEHDKEEGEEDEEDDESEEDEEGWTIRHSNNNPRANDSGVRTGTAPFIAIELLMFGSPHRVVHDLESVFYVLLFMCTHLDGPYHSIGNPPLYGPEGKNHPSPMKAWLAVNRFTILGHLKNSHMVCHFEEVILSHISPYFEPLKPHLKDLWSALHPQITDSIPVGRPGSHSLATSQSVIDVFKHALQDDKLINEARQSSSTLGKCSLPGDLVSTGWDAVKVPEKLLTSEPQRGAKEKRHSILMSKRRRNF